MIFSSQLESVREMQREQARVMRDTKEIYQLDSHAYAISSTWFGKWKQCVGYGKDEATNVSPGEIDNSSLVDSSLQLRKDVSENKDYIILTEPIWKKLLEWYGGGPEIALEIAYDPATKKNKPITNFISVNIIYNKQTVEFTISPIKPAQLLRDKAIEHFGIEKKDSHYLNFYDPETELMGNLVLSDKTLMENNVVDGCDLELVYVPPAFLNMRSMLPRPSASSNVSLNSYTFTGASKVAPHVTIKQMMMKKQAEVKENDDFPKSQSHQGSQWQSSLPTQTLSRGVCGFQNIGNSCFLNSALQCIFHTPPLVEYFLNNTTDNWRNHINISNPLGTRGALVSNFFTVLSAYWSGETNLIAPRELRNVIGMYAPQFASYTQQDAQELLMFLLDFLHEDLNIVSKKPEVLSIEGNGEDDERIASEAWEYHISRDNSIIVSLFHGLLRTELCCPSCNAKVTCFDPFSFLSLPIPTSEADIITTFLYIPFNPHEASRQMRYKSHPELNTYDFTLAFDNQIRQELKDNELNFAYCEVSSNGKEFKWLSYPKKPQQNTRLYVFQIPDPSKFYIAVNLYAPGNIFIEGPFLVEISGPKATKEEIHEVCNNYFVYLWESVDPLGMDARPVSPCILELQKKMLGGKKIHHHHHLIKSNSSAHIATKLKPKKLLFSKNKKLKSEVNISCIATRHVKVSLLPPYAGIINWRRLKREIHEIFIPEFGKKEIELKVCLNAFTQKTKLDQSNEWHCPKCNKKVCADRTTDIWKLPRILIFHLKRFHNIGGSNRKLDTNVLFPEEIDMAEYTNVPAAHELGTKYKLYAVSEHMGCIGSGHYTAHAFTNGKWYSFNDGVARPCSAHSIHTPNAYILFYERVDAGDYSNSSDD